MSYMINIIISIIDHSDLMTFPYNVKWTGINCGNFLFKLIIIENNEYKINVI